MIVPQYSFIHFKSYKAEWDEWGTWVSVTADSGSVWLTPSCSSEKNKWFYNPAWQMVINAARIIWLPGIKAAWRFIFYTGPELTGWQVMPRQIRMIISSAPGSCGGNNVPVHHKHLITPYLRIMIVISMILYARDNMTNGEHCPFRLSSLLDLQSFHPKNPPTTSYKTRITSAVGGGKIRF